MKLLLTDRFCQHAKANGAVQADFYDEDTTGLVFRVSAAGKRTWTFIYTSPLDGKRVRLALGTYPATSLGRARERATDARKLVEEGKDPKREQAAEEAVQTVSDLVENYLVRDKTAKRRSVDEIARRLRKNVSGRDAEGKTLSGASKGCIGDVRLSDLNKLDITKCINAIVSRGAKIEANRVFEDLRAMVRWAKAQGYLNDNLMEGREKPTETVERDRFLSAEEIRTVWNALPNSDMRESTRRIVRLCLITGQRVGEVAGMTLGELSADMNVWTIPPERAKNGKEHKVPISDMARAIIREQIAEVRVLSERKKRPIPSVIFAGPGGKASVTAAAVAKAIKRQEIVKRGEATILGIEPWTAHDLRRTAATHMEEIGISPFIIAHLLNHISITKANITSKIYARYDYYSEKRESIDLWNDRLNAIIHNLDAKVIPMNARGLRKNNA
jgi:integrase